MSDKAAHQDGADVTATFVRRTIEEAEAMARHALEHGLVVPLDVIAVLPRLRHCLIPQQSRQAGAPPQPEAPALSVDAGATTGLPVVGAKAVSELAEVHQKLSRLVSPAKPHCLWQLAQSRQANSKLQWLGSVPLMRHMMLLAIAFLVGLIGLSLHSSVNSTNLTKPFLDNFGSTQLLCQTFLLCAAGLGACFAALFRVGRALEAGTYDTHLDSAQYSRLVLGLMAGIMLAELVGPQFFESSNGADHLGATASQAFAKPTLAVLGGFSATVVYRVLERLVQAVESLVAGDAELEIESKVIAIKTRAQSEFAEEKMKVAGKLTKLGAQGEVSDATKQSLHQLVLELLGSQETLNSPSVDKSSAQPETVAASETEERITVPPTIQGSGFGCVTLSSDEPSAQCATSEAVA